MSSATATPIFSLFFFNDTATTEIYTLSLHDALPILASRRRTGLAAVILCSIFRACLGGEIGRAQSELQSPDHLVCRLLLEKKKSRGPRREVESGRRRGRDTMGR